MCKYPFIRDTTGDIRWMSRATQEQRKDATPFPCGKCLPCRINKARTWTHRILLEQMEHTESTFLTLTYNEEHLPKGNTLKPKDLTNYLKRLRNKTGPFRYYVVGEYGEHTDRPHYHCILFGLGVLDHYNIQDKWTRKKKSMGLSHLGEVNKDSAQYIAGYINKKLDKHNPALRARYPEFQRSSKLNGGIGHGAIKRIADNIISNPYRPPEIIRELRYGTQKKPLGRYLTQKLASLLGVPQEQFESEFWIHQEVIFEQHLNQDWYYGNIQTEKKAQRHQQKKRSALHKKRNTI